MFACPAWTQLEDAIRADHIYAVLGGTISKWVIITWNFPQHEVHFIAVSGGIDSDTNSTDILPLYSVMDE